MAQISTPSTITPRSELALTGRGLIAEPVPLLAANTTQIPTAGTTSGTLVASLVGLRAGDVITSISCFLTTTGTSLTFAKLGLLDSTGTFLKATAESSTVFNASSPSLKTVNLTSSYTATADGSYYVCFLQFGSGATGATLACARNGAVLLGQSINSGLRACAQVATQTDIAAGTYTLADSQNCWWFGLG